MALNKYLPIKEMPGWYMETSPEGVPLRHRVPASEVWAAIVDHLYNYALPYAHRPYAPSALGQAMQYAAMEHRELLHDQRHVQHPTIEKVPVAILDTLNQMLKDLVPHAPPPSQDTVRYAIEKMAKAIDEDQKKLADMEREEEARQKAAEAMQRLEASRPTAGTTGTNAYQEMERKARSEAEALMQQLQAKPLAYYQEKAEAEAVQDARTRAKILRFATGGSFGVGGGLANEAEAEAMAVTEDKRADVGLTAEEARRFWPQGLEWGHYTTDAWWSALCQACMARFRREPSTDFGRWFITDETNVKRVIETRSSRPGFYSVDGLTDLDVRRYLLENVRAADPAVALSAAGYVKFGTAPYPGNETLRPIPGSPGFFELIDDKGQATRTVRIRDFNSLRGAVLDASPLFNTNSLNTTPQAPEKKTMTTEATPTPKKSKKTVKEQAGLLGGAMAQGIGMGLTNQAGEVLLEMAGALAPGNKYIQDALKDPAGRELIKVTMAVLLHTACESGAPLPGAAHIATATRSQVAFSSAVLTGYAIKQLGGQLTALATLGQQLEALPSNAQVEEADFDEVATPAAAR